MRMPGIFVWVLAANCFPQLAVCACGPAPVVDWGLHRQWVMRCDGAHPDRPPVLVEVPWNEPRPKPPSPADDQQKSPLVRTGMRVTLLRSTEGSQVHLTGTALGSGHAGNIVLVRAGLGQTPLRGVIRGPALVELEPAPDSGKVGK